MRVFTDGKYLKEDSLSLWRKYRHSDWRSLCFGCIIFIAGCVLASMSWKLEASFIFVLLYILLGTSGFLISYLNVFKVVSKKESECLPLLPSSHFKVATYKQHKISDKKYKSVKIENILNSSVIEKRTENECKFSINNINEKYGGSLPTHSLETGNDGNKGVITCVETCYTPQVTREQYATGPTPGIGHSRKAGDVQGTGRQRLSFPFMGPFRIPSQSGASAQFQVPLREIPGSRLDESSSAGHLAVSDSQPISDVQEEQRWMSTNPHEPIYQNIVPYPKRKLNRSENDLLKCFEYDNPKELRRIEGDRCEMSPSRKQSTGSEYVERRSSAIVGKDRNKSVSHLGIFIPKGRSYVNVPPFHKEQRKLSSHVASTSRSPTKIQDFETGDKYSKSRFDPSSVDSSSAHNIYVNISPEVKKISTESTEVRNIRKDHDRSKTHELRTIKKPEYPLSPKKHQNQKDTPRDSKVAQNIKSEIMPTSPLPENIYVNIASLKPETKNQPGKSYLDNKSLLKLEEKTGSAESPTASKSQNIYVNVPSSSNSARKQQTSSESEYSADTETEVSTSGEYSDGNCAERKDRKKARSDYMYVTALGPTLKTYVKPGASDIRNTHLELSRHIPTKSVESVCSLATDDSLHVTTESKPSTSKDNYVRTQQESVPLDDEKYMHDKSVLVYDPSLNPTKMHQSRRFSEEHITETEKQTQSISTKNENRDLMDSVEKMERLSVDDEHFRQSNVSVKTKREKETKSNFKCESSKVEPHLPETSESKVRSPESKHGYENPLYNVVPRTERKYSGIEREDEFMKIKKKFSSIASSDEDPFCISKSISSDKTSESRALRFTETASECSSYSEDSVFLSKNSYQSEYQGLSNLEDVFSPTEQPSSSRFTSIDACSSKNVSMNKPSETPTSLQSAKTAAATFINPTAENNPRIVPPLGRASSSQAIRASLGNSPYPGKVEIPVILNRSSIVQAQLKKFSALNRGTVPFVKLPPKPLVKSQLVSSRHAMLQSKSQDRLPESKLQVSRASTRENAARDLKTSHSKTSPSKAMPLEKRLEPTIPNVSQKPRKTANIQCAVPHAPSSDSPGGSKSPDTSPDRSTAVRKHPSAYF